MQASDTVGSHWRCSLNDGYRPRLGFTSEDLSALFTVDIAGKLYGLVLDVRYASRNSWLKAHPTAHLSLPKPIPQTCAPLLFCPPSTVAKMSSSQGPQSPKGPESPKSPNSPGGKAASPEPNPAPPAIVALSAEESREAGILPGAHWTEQPVISTSSPATLFNEYQLMRIPSV